jgi:hypothetical protein
MHLPMDDDCHFWLQTKIHLSMDDDCHFGYKQTTTFVWKMVATLATNKNSYLKTSLHLLACFLPSFARIALRCTHPPLRLF